MVYLCYCYKYLIEQNIEAFLCLPSATNFNCQSTKKSMRPQYPLNRQKFSTCFNNTSIEVSNIEVGCVLRSDSIIFMLRFICCHEWRGESHVQVAGLVEGECQRIAHSFFANIFLSLFITFFSSVTHMLAVVLPINSSCNRWFILPQQVRQSDLWSETGVREGCTKRRGTSNMNMYYDVTGLLSALWKVTLRSTCPGFLSWPARRGVVYS